MGCGDSSTPGAPDQEDIATATLPATLPEARIIDGELTREEPPAAETPSVDVTPDPAASEAPAATAQTATPGTPSSGARTYTVKSGDIPQAIAAQFDVTVEALLAANPGLDTRGLQVGQVLNIPPADD